MFSMIMNLSALTAIAGCDFATFSVCPMNKIRESDHQRIEWKTYRKPQSSHSNTGFQPSLLLHKSHLPINNPLGKNISNGFQPVPAVGSGLPALPRLVGDTDPLSRLGFPGFNSVNRWTRGAT